MYKLQLLETSFSAPFNVSRKSDADFYVDSNISIPNQKKIGSLVVNKMARDLRKEAKILNKFSNGKLERRTLDAVCENLILNFKNPSSLRVWDGDTNSYIRGCEYQEYWWDFIW
ncbi:unnamed protein product [Withania somnifera]